MDAIDSHCHLHDSEFYPEGREEVYRQSIDAGVAMICVGTNVRSSQEAVDFAASHEHCYAVVGVHPHDSKGNDVADIRRMVERYPDQIVGIGEIGLDYFYDHSPREIQLPALREQLRIARDFDLPVSFHVREAFDDFWPIYDEFREVRGVLHSFTDTQEQLDKGFARGLYVGVNGISTFTKDEHQQAMYRDIPLEKMLLETDAPFLTPNPFRGRVNVPAYVVEVAASQATLKGVAIEDVIRITTANARSLFRI